MTTQSQSNHAAAGTPTLDAFITAARAAGEQGEVHVRLDGQNFLVLAHGRTATGRDVSWIANDEPDATSIYLSVFQKHYGQRLTEAVKENFSDLSPGKPLSARTVTLALEMADRSLTALSGVDFLTRLQSSAMARGRNFDQACSRLGIDASSVSGETRGRIDADIQRRFQAALVNGESPVDTVRMQAWLDEALRREVFPTSRE